MQGCPKYKLRNTKRHEETLNKCDSLCLGIIVPRWLHHLKADDFGKDILPRD